MYFSWKDEYSVNIKHIDDQHKKLFEIGRNISNMIFICDASYNKEDITAIFSELKNYTEFHFKSEEILMKEQGYVHYETHKNEHDILIERIIQIEEKFNENVQKDILMELINLIFEWISIHILKVDKKFKDLLSSDNA